MSFLDFIKNLLGNNKRNARIITRDLHKTYKSNEPLEIGLYENKTPLTGKTVDIKINGVTYSRETDNDGIAKLNINLDCNVYEPIITFKDDEFNKATASCNVYVNPNITTKDLELVEKDGSRFQAKLTDAENNIIKGAKVIFTVNGRSYERTSDDNGIAELNINLGAGDYKIITKCVEIVNENTIHVKPQPPKQTRMEGTDVNKNYGDATPYQCAVYDDQGRIAVPVNMTVNGKTYTRTPDIEGLCKLNINLGPGRYILRAEFTGDNKYLGSSVENTITINEPPKPEPSYTLHPYITEQGAGELGQRTEYTCGPHSLMQCIYRLTGIELSEMELASVCGTTSNGTSHDGLATGLAWFNRKYGYNIKMTWYNFSEIGFEGTQKAMENGACFHHILYRNQWGHYEVPKWTEGNPIYVLNSLGSSCGGGYCGYVEERSRSTHQSYINGISQKSVCILTR